MFDWFKKKPKEVPEPVERWVIKSEREHFIHMQFDCAIWDLVSVAEELRELGLSIAHCGVNPMRDYKLDFVCQKQPSYTGMP